MSVLYIKDKATGEFHGIRTIRGPIGPVGPTGNSGVHMSTEKPTDPTVNLWINPDGSVRDNHFELIEEYTLETDSYLWRISEPDGTPYDFRKIRILLETTANVSGVNLQVYSSSEDGGGLICQNYLYEQNANGSTLSAFVETEIDAGLARSLSSTKWASGMALAGTNGAMRYVGDISIKRFGSSAKLPAGTVVRVWGVRN